MMPRLLLLTSLFLLAYSSRDESALFVRVLSPSHLSYTYEIIPAQFGPPIDVYAHTHRGIHMVAATIHESCHGLVDDVSGKAVIMPRGECSFVEKVAAAETAGALFALVTEVNSSSTTAISMSRGELNTPIHIPSAYMAGTSGSRLHRYLSFNNDPLVVDIPINGTDIAILFEKAPWELW